MKKILMSATVLGLMLTACSEDYPERTPSYKPASDVISAYFPNTIPGTVEVAPAATSYTFPVSRVDSTQAVTIKLIKTKDVYNVFTIPAEVSFAAGQKTANVTVTFPDLVDFRAYLLGVSLEEATTNPYKKSVPGTSELALTIAQTDWVDYGVGTLESEFFGFTGENTIQYSAILDSYKILDMYVPGYGLQFSKDGESGIEFFGTTSTGYVDADYGLFSMTGVAESSSYSGDVFTLSLEFTVSLGSFGAFNEVFTITDKF